MNLIIVYKSKSEHLSLHFETKRWSGIQSVKMVQVNFNVV